MRAMRTLGVRAPFGLRQRLSVVSVIGVGAALLSASAICYVVVRRDLRGQVDAALRAQAQRMEGGGLYVLGAGPMPAPPPRAGGPAQYVQIITAAGSVLADIGGVRLPVDALVRSVARGTRASAIEDVQVAGSHLRMLSLMVAGGAVQLARPLDSIDHVDSELAVLLVLICGAGTGLAATLSRLWAGSVLRPLTVVADTAQHISESGDLTRRLHPRGDDEVARLASRFNVMLERVQSSRTALERSAHAQRQLVSDASHELRTPVTSLRTNVELLIDNPHMATADREQLLDDVVEQTEELTSLVAGLVELARDDTEHRDPFKPVRLDELVLQAVARERRNVPGVRFDAQLAPLVVRGSPARLVHAINNLLDNAVRHTPPGEVVEVSLSPAGLRIRDHGTGIDADDLPKIFDPFYRGVRSRSTPGNGLGLAIVRQVIVQHGGTVAARNAPDGGAIFEVALPLVGDAGEPA